VKYKFVVAVYDEQEVPALRVDERIMANNAKPDEEWVVMMEQIGKTILQHATSQTPHHPFAREYRVLISRETVPEEEAVDASA
jgi:hypothetical protein